MEKILKALGAVSLIAIVASCSSGTDDSGTDTPPPDPDPIDEPDPVFAARAVTFTQAGNPLREALAPGEPSTSNTAVIVTATGPDTYTFDFVDGYSQDTDFTCVATAGSDLDCSTSAGNVTESGSYAALNGEFSGAVVMFAIADDGEGTYQIDNSVYFENNQSTAAPVVLPSGSVTYSGLAEGGALIGTVNGGFEGTATVTADFDTNLVDGSIDGAIQSGEAMTATWSGAVYDPTIEAFTTAEGTTFTSLGTASDGGVDGGFFGPNGEEVAGGLWVGNENAGGSFVFIAEQ